MGDYWFIEVGFKFGCEVQYFLWLVVGVGVEIYYVVGKIGICFWCFFCDIVEIFCCEIFVKNLLQCVYIFLIGKLVLVNEVVGLKNVEIGFF